MKRRYQYVHARWMSAGLALVLAAGLLGDFGCSGCMPKQPAGVGGQTPDAPPGVQLVGMAQRQYDLRGLETGPRMPAPAGNAQPINETPPPAPVATGALTQSTYAELVAGMTFEQVIDIVGPPDMVVSRSGARSEMYRWTNESGDSYMAKFENGVLVRKTKLNIEEERKPSGGQTRITMKQYNQIEKGMSEERISQILGFKSKLVAGNNYNVHFYQWTDSTGTNFTAKFSNKRLDSMTGLLGPVTEEESATPEVAPQSRVDVLEDPPAAQPLGGSLSRKEVEALASDTRVPRLEELQEVAAEESPPPREGVQRITSTAPARASPRVTVVGGAREEPAAGESREKSSYAPRASLPGYSHSLRRGVYELRFVNDSKSQASAGVRSGKQGRDMTIAAGASESIFVDRGQYAFHYIYKDDPYTLYSGAPLSVDGQVKGDLEVRLKNGDYAVNELHEIFVPDGTTVGGVPIAR